MALVAAAFRGRQDSDVNALLQQFLAIERNHSGDHTAGTIVPFQNGTARQIHYPIREDFPESGRRTGAINENRRRSETIFTVDHSFGDKLIRDVEPASEFARFLRGWYGQPDLGIVVEIGTHFSRPTRVWVPDNPQRANYTTGAWLGCSYDLFNCNSSNGLGDSVAFRGVR